MAFENDGNWEDRYYKEVINKIQQLIKTKRISQYALSMKTCITQSTLSKILNGGSTLTLPQLLRICRALDVDPKSLFTFNESSSIRFGEFENMLENDNIVCSPARTAFKGYLNQSYHVYFYPTISGENRLLHGILRLYESESSRRCRVDLCLYTGKMDMDGIEITKNYSGEMIISITTSTCYCILFSPEIGEVCFFSFHHMFLMNQDMVCRMAAALTTSSGENRRPAIHRLLLSREELDIASENSLDLQLIRGQLRLNNSSIKISQESYEELLSSAAVKESEELNQFLHEFGRICKRETYCAADEESLRGIKAPTMTKILGISLLRDYSTSPKYNKASARTDEYLLKYLKNRKAGRDTHVV